MAREVGPLLASGRDGDIYEYGPGRVLRRARDGRTIAGEARVMEYVRAQGYPVPEVFDVLADGSEIVMERIEGGNMFDEIGMRFDRYPKAMDVLADLHDQLHEITAPDWMTQLPDDGDRVVHLDLHPLNVMMSPKGPVVIDWTNASRGEPRTDAAMSYVLLTCPNMPGPRILNALVGPFRRALAGRFVKRWNDPEFAGRLAVVADLKALDTNMYPNEVEACRKLAVKARRRGARPTRGPG